MELVLKNPYRVLGLSSTASTRDIAKRVSDLETFAELGKAKPYPYDFPGLGPVDRSHEAIKEAARKIEQPEGRIFHSLFWFRAGDAGDELALESLTKDLNFEAASLWSKLLSKRGATRYTWRLNRCVLHLANSNVYGIDTTKMDEALEDLGLLLEDDLDTAVGDISVGNEFALDKLKLWKRVIDEVISLVESDPEEPYGENCVLLLDSLWSFPEAAQDYASAKIINPLIDKIKEAIKASEGLREDEDLEALQAKNGLQEVETIIWALEQVLGEQDNRFQTIANAYADEVCDCAIAAINKFKNPKLAKVLIEWAEALPSFARVKTRIEENREVLEGWFEDDYDDEIFAEINEKLSTSLHTLPEATRMFDDMRRSLVTIKTDGGVADAKYIKISSACAAKLLNHLIKTVNSAQERFLSTKNITALRATVNGARDLNRKLLWFDLDEKTRERVSENLKVVENISSAVTAGTSVQRPQSAGAHNQGKTSPGQPVSAGNFLEMIPGWLWVIGIIGLLSMCSGS